MKWIRITIVVAQQPLRITTRCNVGFDQDTNITIHPLASDKKPTFISQNIKGTRSQSQSYTDAGMTIWANNHRWLSLLHVDKYNSRVHPCHCTLQLFLVVSTGSLRSFPWEKFSVTGSVT